MYSKNSLEDTLHTSMQNDKFVSECAWLESWLDPRVMQTKFQEPQKLKLKFNNHRFLRLQIITLCQESNHAHSYKSLAFLVSKMGWNTLVAHTVSNLKAKLWKVLMKCKSVMFFKFWVLFLKMYLLVVATFFLPSTYSVKLFLTHFSVSSNLYGLCFWWSIFHLCNSCYYDWEGVVFL